MGTQSPPRFSWPMRIFLSVAVAYLIGRSLTDHSLTDPQAGEADCAAVGV